MPMKAILYARVSGPSDPRTASLESQEESCRIHAAKIGATVLEVFVERHTGAELHERPQLMAAMERLRKGEAQALICHSVDRLSRDPLHLGVILSTAEQFNYEVHFANDVLDVHSVEGQLVTLVRGIAAKVQRLSIIEATRRGQIKRLESGKIGGQGPELYGYRKTPDGRRAIYEPEAEIVRQIFDWYGSERLGIRAIAIRLQSRGVPTPSQSKGYARSADVWGIRAIATILRNPAYVGREHANRQQVVTRINRNTGKKYKAKVFRPVEETTPLGNITPAIITEEAWRAAQQQLTRNRGEAARNTTRPYLLRGLIFCGKCRRRMSPIAADGNYSYYRCYGRSTAITEGCGQSVSIAKTDSAVWRRVATFMLNSDTILKHWIAQQSDNPTTNHQAKLDELTARLVKLERGRDRLIEFIATTDDEPMIEATRAKLHQIAEERNILLREMETAQALATEEVSVGEKADAWGAIIQQFSAQARTEDFTMRRQILEGLNCQIIVSQGEVEIRALDHTRCLLL